MDSRDRHRARGWLLALLLLELVNWLLCRPFAGCWGWGGKVVCIRCFAAGDAVERELPLAVVGRFVQSGCEVEAGPQLLLRLLLLLLVLLL